MAEGKILSSVESRAEGSEGEAEMKYFLGLIFVILFTVWIWREATWIWRDQRRDWMPDIKDVQDD